MDAGVAAALEEPAAAVVLEGPLLAASTVGIGVGALALLVAAPAVVGGAAVVELSGCEVVCPAFIGELAGEEAVEGDEAGLIADGD